MKKIAAIILASILLTSCEERLLGPEPENTPQSNFEILWKTFDEKYALFAAKHINWDSLHTFYGAMITASTTDDQLWNICAGLLSNLDDGHVVLINRDVSKIFSAGKIGQRKMDDFSLDLIKQNFLDGCVVAGQGRITYGKVKNNNIGYIHISSFSGTNFGNGVDWAYAIDSAVAKLQGCDGMIVDVRNNGGGLRVTGDIIVSAFIDREITYFYQRLKTGRGHDDFGPVRKITITPRPNTSTYTKKIAFLTNRFSASGSEYAAQIFKNLSYSTQIGDTTYGVFGEITSDGELPNGWIFWYPCTVTTTPDGVCHEGVGILPDKLVENTAGDIAAGRDNVLTYAAKFLSH
jgi:carboxyl-terminal processing protease